MIGNKAAMKKIITANDVDLFSQLSSDLNPLHLDEEYAKKTIFKRRIAHGFLVGSLISAVIANKLPGEGTIYLNQEMNFKKPVFLGDEIEAVVEVLEELRPSVFKLKTTCFNQSGDVVIDGNAIVKWGRVNG